MFKSVDGKKELKRNFTYRETVKSRYLSQDKRKYYLAGFNQNYQEVI